MGSLKRWARKDIDKDVEIAVKDVAINYKKQIKAGNDGANRPMARVLPVTMDLPVRIKTDATPRREVNGSVKPLVARGRMVNSIRSKKTGKNFEIGASTPHGNIVLSANANPAARGIQTRAPIKRNPLVVSNVQVRMIEKEILKGLDKALRR